MGVININVGSKRVALTAYCPDDELGLCACDYVLKKVQDELGAGVSDADFRAYLIGRDPEYTELFKLLDAGWRLPKSPPFTVAPGNIHAELRIVEHLLFEQRAQRAGVERAEPLRSQQHPGRAGDTGVGNGCDRCSPHRVRDVPDPGAIDAGHLA